MKGKSYKVFEVDFGDYKQRFIAEFFDDVIDTLHTMNRPAPISITFLFPAVCIVSE